MRTEFDNRGGFTAQMNDFSHPQGPDTETLKKGFDTAKGHIALVLAILALVIAFGLIPYAFFLDMCVDVVNVFAAEALQSTQDFDAFIAELGLPIAIGRSLYNILSTAKLSRFLTLMALAGLMAGAVSIVLSVLAIVFSVRKPKPSTATAALIVGIVAFVICFFTLVIGAVCLLL